VLSAPFCGARSAQSSPQATGVWYKYILQLQKEVIK